MANILSIKLNRPTLPEKRISRPAIIQKLNEGLESGHAITLISAPAGFGKTICASDWLSRLAIPVGWLSLDLDDNEPARFFTYMAAALYMAVGSKIEGSFPQLNEIVRILRSGQLPPAEEFSSALLSDILEYPDQFILVLDDFHVIQEPFILKVLEKVISGLFQVNNPQPLHLVLLTREDPSLPLARLRANKQLTEIRASDLRFNLLEAREFLNEVMSLGLVEKDINILEEKTEGWIAGLQMAELSIRGRTDPSDFIQSLRGNQRFILSYLTEEVINRQTVDIQEFLLETSILDRMNGELCNAVTGRTNSQMILEELTRTNLFVTSMDEEQRWYRYHHLFADLLRSRLAVLHAGKINELHHRASQWFARAFEDSKKGKSEVDERTTFASAAVRHALEAKEFTEAVQFIENSVMDLVNLWLARTVSEWMHALPLDSIAQSPRTNIAFARMHLTRGEIAEASPYLSRLRSMFEESNTHEEKTNFSPLVISEWLALQSALCSAQGKLDEGLELAQQAVQKAIGQEPETYIHAYMALADAYKQIGDIPHATIAYDELISLGRASSNIAIELVGISTLALIAIERGQLRRGFELAAQGEEVIRRSGTLPPISAAIYGELGQISYNWVKIDQAEYYFQRAVQVTRLGGFSDGAIFYAVYRSRLNQMRGEIDAAYNEIQKAAELMREDAPAVVREEVVAQQVNVFIIQGDLQSAERVLFREVHAIQGNYALPQLAEGQNIPYSQGVLYISALRIMLHRAKSQGKPAPAFSTDSLPDAIDLANRVLANFLQHQYQEPALQTLLLRGQLHEIYGHQDAWLEDFSAALDMAEPEGYISDFVAEGKAILHGLQLLLQGCKPESPRAVFITKILDAFPQSLLASSPPPVEGLHSDISKLQRKHTGLLEELTDRELEVLQLIAGGQTYEQIARVLVVSINTVRSHVKAIYGKLGVGNRTSAIGTARQLKILQ